MYLKTIYIRTDRNGKASIPRRELKKDSFPCSESIQECILQQAEYKIYVNPKILIKDSVRVVRQHHK